MPKPENFLFKFDLYHTIAYSPHKINLNLRHDAGTRAQPYVDGILLAIRKISTLNGLHRGLDCVMDF